MMFVEVFSGNTECLLNRDREKTRLILMDMEFEKVRS